MLKATPLFKLTLLAPELLRTTAPVKLLALPNVITPAPALMVAVPALAACVIAPVCVIPTPVRESVPVPIDEAPMLKATALLKLTLLAPELLRETAPVKLFEIPNVITPAPALIVAVPALAACVIAPVCVIPTPVRESVPVPIDEAPMLKATALFKLTLLAPELLRETAPVKLFELPNVITPAPPLMVVAPALA